MSARFDASLDALAESQASLEKTVTEFKARHERLIKAAKVIVKHDRFIFGGDEFNDRCADCMEIGRHLEWCEIGHLAAAVRACEESE